MAGQLYVAVVGPGDAPPEVEAEANSWVDVAMATGMGEGRNVLVVRAADAVVAVAGGYGTLSEVALALKIGRPVVGLGTWDIPGVEAAEGPHDAAARAVALALRR